MKITLVDDPLLHTNRLSWQRATSISQDCACDCGYIPLQGNDISPLVYPTIYSLELTPICNNKCPGCGNVFGDPEHRATSASTTLSVKRWEHILDKIAPYAQGLKLTGGEPTLHPQFELIVQAVQQRGISFSLFTNGRWQDPGHIITLMKDTTPKVGLLVSLHGADAKAHEAFTGIRGSFAETIGNIRRAVQAGLNVHTNTVLTKHNHHQVETILSLSQSLGAECAVFNRYIGQPLSTLELSLPDLKQAVQEVERLGHAGHRVKFGTCIPQCFVESSSIGCLAGTAYCTIDPWGNVRPCNHAPQIAGNLLTDTLESIWHSETMQIWRDLIPGECQSCTAFTICHGGCRADAVLKGFHQDVLMTTPIQSLKLAQYNPEEEELLLCECAVPHLEYTLCSELFGLILTKGSDNIPISDQVYPILEAMQQPATLRQIQMTYGDEAIDFIGKLYSRGVISLSQ